MEDSLSFEVKSAIPALPMTTSRALMWCSETKDSMPEVIDSAEETSILMIIMRDPGAFGRDFNASAVASAGFRTAAMTVVSGMPR